MINDFYTNVQTLGNYICVRGYDKEGKRYQEKYPYKPSFYIKSNNSENDCVYRTINNHPLREYKSSGIKDARDFVRKYEDIDNFEIHGLSNFQMTYISETWEDEIEYDFNKIKILYMDIEVESENGFPEPKYANEIVNAISMMVDNLIVVLGCGEYEPDSSSEYKIKYIKCRDEKELLEKFIEIWRRFDPDIITGWNVKYFDIPYLVNRIKKIFGEKHIKYLSPWGFVRQKETILRGRQVESYTISGISTIDYFDLYKKWGVYHDLESYRLDHVAHVELDERKIDYSEVSSLHSLYKTNYKKFLDYNIHDTVLVKKLDDKKQLMQMLASIAYYCKVNFEDCFMQTRMWDALIYNHLIKQDIIVPYNKPKEEHVSYAGAYVKDPLVGLHDWIVSFDLNSLYPHLIMQFNIGPDTIVEGEFDGVSVDNIINGNFKNESEYGIAANGYYFRQDKTSFLSELMSTLYNRRLDIKNKMQQAKKEGNKDLADVLDVYQHGLKITLNSCYGSIGNRYFRFFDIRQAEAITLSGQLVIKYIAEKINEQMNSLLNSKNEDYIVAIDTDSVYITFDKLVEKIKDNKTKSEIVDFLDKKSKEIMLPFIHRKYEQLANQMNVTNKMEMSREVIADRGVWTAKKRYVLNVHDMEGYRYKEPELKIMGIEAVKSSTPEYCRDKIKEAMRIFLQEGIENMREYVSKCKDEFKSLPFEDVASPRGVSKIVKFKGRGGGLYEKSTPIHVRGSLLYNHLVSDMKLQHKYELIREGEKIKYCYLVMPNPYGENVISVGHVLPPEFGIEKYIDFDKQFSKSFLEPLDIIMKASGLELEKRNTLEGFITYE